MPDPVRCLLPLVLLVSIAAGACGPGTSSPPNDRHWHAKPSAGGRDWGLARKGYVEMRLPEARHAQVEWEHGTWRIIVYLLASGDVMCKGNVYQLATGDPEERRQALTALQNELDRLTADPASRKADGSSRILLLIHADREVAWRDIEDVISVAREPGFCHLQWSVHRAFAAFRRREWHQEAVLPPLSSNEPLPASDALKVHLLARCDNDTDADTVDLAVDERSWSFGPQPESFGDPAFLRRANDAWDEVEGWLATAARGRSAARIEIEDTDAVLPWAYVVKTIDLLVGAGIREVSLPSEGFHLQMGEPDDGLPSAVKDDPVVTPWVVTACILAVLLAFAVTFWPLGRKRTRKPTPG